MNRLIDEDGDGICDDVDDCIDMDEDTKCDEVDECIGENDECGVCNGDNEPQDLCGNCEGEEVQSVELWGECYNIETTITLTLYDNQLTGEIPSEIGNLINLTLININGNQLTGEIHLR